MQPIRRRRVSGASFDELSNNKEWAILNKGQYHELQAAFKKTDQRGGGISFYDLINILRNSGLCISDEKKDSINKELSVKEIKIIDYPVLLTIASSIKKENEENFRGEVPEQNQYLDAFVALGGAADKGGFVSKTTLMEIIKREFELQLDLETIIEGMPGDNLDYEMFCEIFQKDRQNNEGRLASAASQRSLKSNESMKSLNIEERNFQKFLSQYEDNEVY